MTTRGRQRRDGEQLEEALRVVTLTPDDVTAVRQLFERHGLDAALAAINERAGRLHMLTNRRQRDREGL